MKILPIQFTKFNSSFQQLLRINNITLYKRTFKNGGVSFEVFYIINQKEFKINNVTIISKENMPSNSQWGKLGWSFPSYDLALQKFLKLTSNPSPHNHKKGKIKTIINIKFPNKPFTIKDLAKFNNCSNAIAYNNLKKYKNIKIIKYIKGRGKPTTVYSI